MIRDLISEGVLVATVALIAMPLVSRRFRLAFKPIELTRYNSATMGAGMTLLLAALIACAVPVGGALFGAGLTDRHFFPGEEIVGWVSALTALVVVGSGLVGYRRVRKTERLLAIEPSLGLHIPRGPFDLVVLPTPEALAYAVERHGRKQVAISTGLIRELTVQELVSVVEHEAAHLHQKHRLHLTLVAALEPLSNLVPPIRRLVEVTRMALERAADSATTDHRSTRSALLRLSGLTPTPGVAAFTAGDLAERIEALTATDPFPHAPMRAAMYAAAVALAGASVAALGLFWF